MEGGEEAAKVPKQSKKSLCRRKSSCNWGIKTLSWRVEKETLAFHWLEPDKERSDSQAKRITEESQLYAYSDQVRISLNNLGTYFQSNTGALVSQLIIEAVRLFSYLPWNLLEIKFSSWNFACNYFKKLFNSPLNWTSCKGIWMLYML